MGNKVVELFRQIRAILACGLASATEFGECPNDGIRGATAYRRAHRWLAEGIVPSGENMMSIQEWHENILKEISKHKQQLESYLKVLEEIKKEEDNESDNAF